MNVRDLFRFSSSLGKAIWIAVVFLVAAGVVYYFYFYRGTGSVSYVTSQVTRGSIVNKVSATGTVQAVTTVQVGSQASGTIKAIYVDFNSEVHKGQVIAELDPASLDAQVQQATANLDQANAAYKVAQANLANAKAQLLSARSNILNQRAGVSVAQGNLNALKAQNDDAAADLNRQQILFNQGVIAKRDLEISQTTYNAAKAKYEQALAQVNQAKIAESNAGNAGLAQAEASVKQSESQIQISNAQIKQAKAALNLAQVNLSHTTITSPINGVVVSRQVDVGQTVAASLSAPTLFTIANDLTQMQVMANIDEADIGSINQATNVTFSVDAFPGETFQGNIRQMRLQSTTVQNVVTYSVVVNVDNPDQKLKPGMTANLTFVIAKKDNVVRIPNAAFRFVPSSQANGERQGNANGRRQAPAVNDDSSNSERSQIARSTSPVLPGQTRIVWVLGPDQQPARRMVKIGISDGTATEMTDGELQEGEMIITAESTSGTTRTANTQSAPGFGTTGGRPPGR